MSYLVTGMLVAYVLITIGLVTLLLYYGNLAYQCDALVGFWCHTDWQCSGVDGTAADSGTYDAAGNLVPGDKLDCHLKGLYGADPGPDCPGSPVREINPCMVANGDRSDPNSYNGDVLPTAFACTPEQSINGLCSGNFATSNNIPGVANESNSASGTPNIDQYGLGAPPGSAFDCACYFGANVIANSGSNTSTTPLNGDSEGGGKYNISAMACGQIVNDYQAVPE